MIFPISANIYKARNVILGITGSSLTADIPSSYQMPSIPPPVPIDNNPPQLSINLPPMSPLLSPLISPNWQYPMSPFPPAAPPFVGILKQPQFTYNVMHGSMASSGYQSMQMSSSTLSVAHNSRESSVYSPISSASPSVSPRNASPICQGTQSESTSGENIFLRFNSVTVINTDVDRKFFFFMKKESKDDQNRWKK